jgi:hypothetical protein
MTSSAPTVEKSGTAHTRCHDVSQFTIIYKITKTPDPLENDFVRGILCPSANVPNQIATVSVSEQPPVPNESIDGESISSANAVVEFLLTVRLQPDDITRLAALVDKSEYVWLIRH